MLSRLSAFTVWALVAGAVIFWGLRQGAHAPVAPPFTLPVGDTGVVGGELTRLLGAAPVIPVSAVAQPDSLSRFRLLGVVAPRANGPRGVGVALIAIDGKPAKPYRIGARVDGELLLREVSQRSASLGPVDTNVAALRLELPLPVPAATGNLPAATADGSEVPSALNLTPPRYPAPNVYPGTPVDVMPGQPPQPGMMVQPPMIEGAEPPTQIMRDAR